MKSMPTVDPRLLDGGRGITVEYFGGRTIDSEPLLIEMLLLLAAAIL